MIRQKFVVEIATQEMDGCCNANHPKTPGDIRRAVMKGLSDYSTVAVAEVTEVKNPY